MRIFVSLSDCLIGENTSIELFFILLRKKGLCVLWSATSLKDLLGEVEGEMNFNNLLLREEVVDICNKYVNAYPNSNIHIITDLKHVPVELLELQGEISLCDQSNVKDLINNKEEYILITGDFFKNIKYFFEAKKTVFVGPYLLGKVVNMINVGRTTIIDVSYGVFTIIWDYFVSLSNIFVLWPLLFFLPSTSFDLWKYAFFFTTMLNGFTTLWRHFLELENERAFAVNKNEVLMGSNFIYLHNSTFAGIVISLIFLMATIILGLQNFNTLRALVFSLLYNFIMFFFLARKSREYLWVKMITLIILPLIIQPSFISEFLYIKFNS